MQNALLCLLEPLAPNINGFQGEVTKESDRIFVRICLMNKTLKHGNDLEIEYCGKRYPLPFHKAFFLILRNILPFVLKSKN